MSSALKAGSWRRTRACLAVALGIGLGAASCGERPAQCGGRNERELRLDGGIYSCLKAEDCPRASNVPVCVNDVVETSACVQCLQTECVRTVPVGCP